MFVQYVSTNSIVMSSGPPRRAPMQKLYKSLGISPDSGYDFCKILFPNIIPFILLTTLGVLTVIWSIPNGCTMGGWSKCVLDSLQTMALVIMFQINMFYKPRSSLSHFQHIVKKLELSKTTYKEYSMFILGLTNNISHYIFYFPHGKQLDIFVLGVYLVSALLAFCILLQFISAVEHLNEKFVLLNKKTRRIDMLVISEYWALLGMIEPINKVYGNSITFMSIWTVGKLVSNMYDAITHLLVGNISAFLFLSASASFKFGLLFLCMHVCENTKAQAEAFNTELFKLMRGSKELCRDSKLVLYVTMKQTVKFTACGFFTLGYPLITSIIAAATTYLVILIQFSQGPTP